jgi:hypothetical protein
MHWMLITVSDVLPLTALTSASDALPLTDGPPYHQLVMCYRVTALTSASDALLL